MTFFELISAAQKIYALYGFIENTLTDHMSMIMREVAEAEMVSAIKTLEDSKISNNREREFASAITQLRLALGKTKDDLVKAKIAAIIWFCYTVLKEEQLARSFENDSLRYFNSYYDRELNDIVGISKFIKNPCFIPNVQLVRNMQHIKLILLYNQLIDTTKDIGLDMVEKKSGECTGVEIIQMMFDENYIEERATRLVERAKAQYAAMFRDSLPKLA